MAFEIENTAPAQKLPEIPFENKDFVQEGKNAPGQAGAGGGRAGPAPP